VRTPLNYEQDDNLEKITEMRIERKTQYIVNQ